MEIETPEGIRSVPLRSIFDALCAECVGPKEGANLIDEIIRQKKITFNQIIITYFATLSPRTLYYFWAIRTTVEGFIAAIYALMQDSKPTRDWVLSYDWELLNLFAPFDKKNWPTNHLYNLLEKQMHTLVDAAIKSGKN